jgi:hypothetical protein
MRLLAAVSALALASSLAIAAPASAAPVTVKPVAIDAELQKEFEDNYGEREIAVLQRAISGALERELTASGATVADGAPVVIETTLVNVKPSRPTFQQAIDQPGLDTARSVSLGGAELRARVVRADGTTLQEVTHKWYESDLLFSNASTTWSDARRVIRRFADKVGDAYRANAGS